MRCNAIEHSCGNDATISTHNHQRQINDMVSPNNTPPSEERPRERLFKYGTAALSETELLAILIGTGTKQKTVNQIAEQILSRFGDLEALSNAHPSEIAKIRGLGEAKVAQIAAALEIGRRLNIAGDKEKVIIATAKDAAHIVRDMALLTQEQIRLILLNQNREVIDIATIYIGTVNAAVVRVAEIFREALTKNAPAVILAHNHPSGDPTPSPEDIELTKRIIEAGQLLDIVVLDHIIVGRKTWRSLKEMKLAFN